MICLDIIYLHMLLSNEMGCEKYKFSKGSE